jgi:hypothetical protein
MNTPSTFLSSYASLQIALSPYVDALDSRIRDDLQRSSHCFFVLVIVCALTVAVGCLLEGPELIHELWPKWFSFYGWSSTARFERTIKEVAFWGWLMIGVGVSGEGIFEAFQNSYEGHLQTLNDILLEESRVTASSANLEAAYARQDTAQLEKTTEGLKTEAADAKRDMVNAQLELARLTGPVHIIPVINGVATPDLSKGLIQQILLTRDVRIMSPKLPDIGKEGTAPWTLFLDQDSVGSHQYTFQFMRDARANPGLVPNSRVSFEFITDTHGRSTIRGIPLVDIPNTVTPNKKK